MTSKNIVNKEIDLIVKASYRLTLIEQRLILLGIVTVKKTGKGAKPNEWVSFTVQDYMDIFNEKETKTEIYGQLKQALSSLATKTFVLINKKAPNADYVRSESWNWIQGEALYKSRLGVIEFVFSDKVREYIKQLDQRFTQYPIERIADMTSIYPIRLYEILIRWYNQDVKEIKLEVEYLKILLNANDTYKLFANFKQRILDVAVKQINKHSDLTCSYTQHKTGRAVTHLVFEFDLKPEYQKTKATHDATQSIPKRKSNKNISTEVEIVPIAPPHENKAIKPVHATIPLRDQEDWQNLVKALNLRYPYKGLVENSRLISRQGNQLLVKIPMGTQILWQTFKIKLEKLLFSHLNEELVIITRTSADEPIQRVA